MIETLFLNMFYGGKLKSMPPKLQSDDGLHTVIRPLAYCKETDIAHYAEQAGYPIIPCNLCGSQENLQRKHIKAMLQDWHNRFPGRVESIFSAMQNVVPSHVLDHALFDFKTLSGVVDDASEGDTGFDPPELPKAFTSKEVSDDIIELK
jgi:tRNA 2-thiocytidine biosynthesis protein TtcA